MFIFTLEYELAPRIVAFEPASIVEEEILLTICSALIENKGCRERLLVSNIIAMAKKDTYTMSTIVSLLICLYSLIRPTTPSSI